VSEKLIAGIALAVCVALLTRMMLGPRRRQRLDAASRRIWASLRNAAGRAAHWRSSRHAATVAAQDAIARARRASITEGNVIRPRAFRRPRKPH
jgi:hypothetical protein